MMSYRESLLSGVFDVTELRQPTAKIVRLYMCSAGTDTLRERDALVSKVYPRLRDYCRENYGLEFQVVDLKWALGEVWDDHSTDRELCLYELDNCIRQSAGPSFMMLLGQKYGECQLPVRIPEEHFELIRSALKRHKNRDTRDAFQMDQWYVRDENANPPVYVLQTEDDVKNNLRPQTAIDKAIYGERKEVRWETARPDLKRLLRRGLQYCVQDGTLADVDVIYFMISDLEVEIRTGIETNADPASKCHALLRSIVDLKNYVSHPAASRFMEVLLDDDQTPTIDTEAELKLSHLVDNEVHRCLNKGSIANFSVLWKQHEGIDVELHKDHLEQVCATFEQIVRESVDRQVPNEMNNVRLDLELEVNQHWNEACEHYDTFVGRSDVLNIVKSYVMSNDCKPLVIHGVSGAGKTAIMAKAAVETHVWFVDQCMTVVRFLDTTSNIREVLLSLCTQLMLLETLDVSDIPTSHDELQKYFAKLLDEFPDDRNLVLYFDALENLTQQKDMLDLRWLPTNLKSNVKIVIAVSSAAPELIRRLQTEIINDDNNFLEVMPMNDSECLAMLMGLLNAEGRTLSHAQQSHLVNHVVGISKLPMYVKLLLLQARQWTADVNIEYLVFPTCCSEYIKSVFRQLEDKHGTYLTRRALSYLTAAGSGMSDSEIEDVLSLDDDVLNEVLPHYTTTVRRLPSLAWLRLKYDLKDFLRQKQSEGITVFNWTHQRFSELCKDMYLGKHEVKDIHSMLADYYLGVWAGKGKPFTRPSSANNNEVSGDADRLVPKQPLTFESSDTITRYNRRKYCQVPQHLFKARRLGELNDLVLFSYEWMYNKAKATSLESVLSDFTLNPGVEATLVEKALKDAQPFIATNINNMAAEISGRLLPYFNTHPNIRHLIQQCDTLGSEHSAFVPNFPYQKVPGSPLKFSIQTKGALTDMALLGYEGRYALTKNKDDRSIQIYDLVTGQYRCDVLSSVGNMYLSPDGERTVIVDHVTEKTLKIHETQTGKFLGQLIPLNQIQLKPKKKKVPTATLR